MFSLSTLLRRGWLFLALCVLVLPAQADVVLTSQEQAIANYLTNSSGQHRPFLKLDPTLVQVARARAADMGRRDYFDHVNPDGHGPNYLVRAAGYTLPAWWGTDSKANYIESIAAGSSSASVTWGDWMGSAPHKTHLLATDSFYADQTSFGVGFAAVPGSEYSYYWVVITCPPPPVPKLAITAPAAGVRLTNASVEVTGTTSKEGAATRVVYRVENSVGTGSFADAGGLATWTASADLQPGVNTIRVRSYDVNGTQVAEVTRAVTYVVMKPLTVAMTGNGKVTAGFAGETSREVAKSYTVTAAPLPGSLFTGWTGSVTSAAPKITFTMEEGFALTANFILNPFVARAGGYTGLLTGNREGLVQVAVTSGGVFTGALRYGGIAYALRGRFSALGEATLQIPRRGLTPLAVTLHLDVNSTNGVTVSVDDAGQTSTAAVGANYRAVAGKFAGVGTYTVTIPPLASADAPRGSGFGRLTVDTLGRAKLAVSLADGTPALASATFSGDRTLSFYVPLYAAKGALDGTLNLRSQELSDLDGTVRWTKPALPAAKIHPDPIDAAGALLGSLYVRPATGQPVLGMVATVSNGQLMVADGNLPSEVTQPVTISNANRVSSVNPVLPKLSLVINAVSGVFAGTFTHPVTGKASPIRGIFFQRENVGVGYFLGADESGSAMLAPR